MARDLVRVIQTRRRDEGLDVTDRVRVELIVPGDVAAALDTHRAWLAEQTLAVALDILVGEAPNGDGWADTLLPTHQRVWLRVTPQTA